MPLEVVSANYNGRSVWRSTALLVSLFSACIPSFAWGPLGHRVVADVARHHLTPAARRELILLLGTDDLASVSTWADEIRNERPETFGWHFVDIPWDASGFSADRDCLRPGARHPLGFSDHQNCVVERITLFSHTLTDRRQPKSERLDALRFLVHLVADVHQPMHAIGEARGGNDIEVLEFGRARCGSRPCNLHSLWDVGLIEHNRPSEHELAENVERLIARSRLDTLPEGTPADWANASFHLAHEVWLRSGELGGDEYYRRNIDVADWQLALAAIRLAMLLNDCLGR